MRLSWKYLKWREWGTFDIIRLKHSLANALRDAKEGRSRIYKPRTESRK